MKKISIHTILDVTVILIVLLFAFLMIYAKSKEGSPETSLMLGADNELLRKVEGVMYYGSNEFTGVLTKHHDNGQLKEESEYIDGRQEGMSRTYYEGGSLASERTYKGGHKEGVHRGWWENGQLKFEYTFEEGKTEGYQYQWYDDGAKYITQYFEKGYETGLQQGWDKEGKVIFSYFAAGNKKYGVIGSKPCYTVKNGEGI